MAQENRRGMREQMRHEGGDTAQENGHSTREWTQHKRMDTAQENGHSTREWTQHKGRDAAQRDNEAGVSKSKTIKKKTYIELWTNGCSDQGINAAGRGQ